MAYPRRTRMTEATWTPDDAAASIGASPTVFPIELLSYDIASIGSVGGGLQAGSPFLTGPVKGEEMAVVSLRKQLLGHDTSAQPPSWGMFARAAGMEETNVGTPTDDAYKYSLTSSARPHLTTDSTAGDTDPLDITINKDRYKTIALNCVGNCIFTFMAGDIPTVQFDGMGTVNQSGANITASTEAALAGVDTTYDLPAVPFTAGTFSIDWNSSSYSSLVCDGIVINLGAIVQPQRSISAVGAIAQPQIVGYDPSITFSIRETDFATINWESIMRSDTRLIEITALHDKGAGVRNELTINCFGRLANYPAQVEKDGLLWRDVTLTVDPRDTNYGINLTYTSA